MMALILFFHEQANRSLAAGMTVPEILKAPVVDKIFRVKETIAGDEIEKFAELKAEIGDTDEVYPELMAVRQKVW